MREFCVGSSLSCVPLFFSSLATILLRKRKLVALPKLCCGICSVSLPRGAMDWSVVCDYGISWSYLFF